MIRLVPPDDATIAQGLMTALARQANTVLRRSVPGIRRRLRDLIDEFVSGSPEAQSLTGGQLQGELGVREPGRVITAIVEALAASMVVEINEVRPVGNTLTGGLTLRIMRSDLSDVLSVPGGSFESEGGFQIDWLRWLLTAGDSTIIAEYAFTPGPFPGSRTGLGVMRQGNAWRVPSQFSGVPQDNWLTRALGLMTLRLQSVINEELSRVS